MSKLKSRLAMLQRLYPNHSKYGQLYRNPNWRKKGYQTSMHPMNLAYKRVRMWTLYVSDENEHMVRPHVFEKRAAMTAKEWHAWFAIHLDKIQREAILPALSVRTDLSKQWAVRQYIGWTGDAKYASRITAARRARHKAKSQRGTHG